MHLVTMIVKIPEEEWGRFKKEEKETGNVQFKFGNATISAEVF